VTNGETTIIVLTGFMGTGKSTVGRALATRLGYAFVDTDTLIEQRHGAIATIFRERGEEAFRRMEREVAAELGGRERVVIATGGRLMLDPTNAAVFEDAAVFCLTADLDTILQRTAPAQISRPLLAADDRRARIEALLDERALGYASFEQVSTDGQTPEAVVNDIVSRLDAR
jgi:shikimate kinase